MRMSPKILFENFMNLLTKDSNINIMNYEKKQQGFSH